MLEQHGLRDVRIPRDQEEGLIRELREIGHTRDHRLPFEAHVASFRTPWWTDGPVNTAAAGNESFVTLRGNEEFARMWVTKFQVVV